MSRLQKIRWIAFGFVLVSIVNAVLFLSISDGRYTVLAIACISVACVLAFMLLNRANWARWLTGIFSTLSTLIGLIAVTSPAILLSFLGAWLVLATAFYAWAAHVLLRDKEVSRYFGHDTYL